MSGAAPPGGKPRLRDRLSKRLKPFSVSGNTSSISISTKTPSSPASTSTSTCHRPLSPLPVQPSASTASVSSAPQPPTPIHSSSREFLDDALQRLSDRDQQILRPFILPNSSDVGEAMERSLAAARQKQQDCESKRWTFTFAGRTVILKEEADKIVHWLDRFKAVGDVAVSVDPVHAGLPWAGVRFLLEAAVSEANQMASLLVGCETALYMTNRLKAYMEFWRGAPPSLQRTNLRAAMVELYALILSFLARAIDIYRRSTLQRALRSFWQDREVQDFERDCDTLGSRVETEASNCDRMLSGQDRIVLQGLQQKLETLLKDLEQSHNVQASLKQLEKKIDLGNLKYVDGATFDAYGQDHTACHPDTRTALLRDIQSWACRSDSKSIFWLKGMAGTGKSTISFTMAQWLATQGSSGKVDLGASFFFKRGEEGRGSAQFFFPTVIHQLARKIPSLDGFVAKAVASNPEICSKELGEQFKILISQPFQQLVPDPHRRTYIVVVDALDECKREDIDKVLRLWSNVPQFTSIRLRLFLTSRPDLPVQLGFNNVSTDVRHDMVLHEAPQSIVQRDILTFLTDAFAKIRDDYSQHPLLATQFDPDWPGDKVIQELTDMAVPLFIVAATICRFVRDPEWDPQARLDTVLRSRKLGQMSQMAQTYFPILKQMTTLPRDRTDEERLYHEFRTIVGSIVTLAEPLSRNALATLLDIPLRTIGLRLGPFYSVFQIPRDMDAPVRSLHLSFGEFLTSEEIRDQPFSVDSPTTHGMLRTKCLKLLSRPSPIGLCENMCNLSYPGQPRRELDSTEIQKRLPLAVQYACRYWTYHAQHSGVEVCDDDEVHNFLQEHLLHWLEALSLLDGLTNAIEYVRTLLSLVSPKDSICLSALLEDARRFILANRYISSIAPLQLYSSAIVFAPQNSVVRNVCGQVPDWIQQCPITPKIWTSELQKLEGHSDWVNAVAFSPDGSLLASASDDETVRLWDATTGQEVQRLEGHSRQVNAVVFSPDSSLLASASYDKTVRLWDATTGQEVQRLEGYTGRVNAVVFSPDGSLLASASYDQTVRLWDTTTGQEVQRLEGHSDGVYAVAFSPDGSLLASASDDKTVRLWDGTTGQEVQRLEGHSSGVNAVAFSPDGSLLASASGDETVRLWDATMGQEVQRLEGHSGWVRAVAFSPGGSLLASASGDETVRLWDATTGQEVQRLEEHSRQVNAVAFSPDGSLLASASGDQTVRLWDATTGQEVQRPEGHTGRVYAVAFSPDGSLLASASDDQTVRLWDATTGQEVQRLEGHTSFVHAVAFSPDGSLLASVSGDETVRLWDATTGQEVQRLEGHSGWVYAVVFSPDGSLLASVSGDKTVRLWDGTTGQEVQRLEGHSSGVNAVAFSPDGSLLASASGDKTVRLWDGTTGQEVQRLEGHSSGVYAIAFSPDGSLLASASDDKTVRLWDAKTGQQIQILEDRLSIFEISFAKDGHTLLTNRGRISVGVAPSSPGTSVSKSKAGNNFVFKDDWIEYRDKQILWLPHEYRSDVSAVHGNMLALGRRSGLVSFMRIQWP